MMIHMIMTFVFIAFTSIYPVLGAFEWIPSTSEEGIEYYYIAQCMAFNLTVGTNACKAIDENAILVTIPDASVQSDLATNVIDRRPGSCTTGGCCSGAGPIGTGGTYIDKTLNVGGTIQWLNGDPDTSDLVFKEGYPSEALPSAPGLCLSTVTGQQGNAMDCVWSASGIFKGRAAICQRKADNVDFQTTASSSFDMSDDDDGCDVIDIDGFLEHCSTLWDEGIASTETHAESITSLQGDLSALDDEVDDRCGANAQSIASLQTELSTFKDNVDVRFDAFSQPVFGANSVVGGVDTFQDVNAINNNVILLISVVTNAVLVLIVCCMMRNVRKYKDHAVVRCDSED